MGAFVNLICIAIASFAVQAQAAVAQGANTTLPLIYPGQVLQGDGSQTCPSEAQERVRNEVDNVTLSLLRESVVPLLQNFSCGGNGWRCVAYLDMSDPSHQPPTTSQCGSHLTSATGAFQTPNWPLAYPANTDCEWTIELPDMRKVANLTFSSTLFSIPGGGSSCSEAYVEILANEGVSISLGRFCGNSIPSPITSSTNKIKVVFHSGTTLSAFLRGFKLSYESVNLEGILKFE